MSACCEDVCSMKDPRGSQRRTLKIVLAINLVMFFVIAAASVYGNSTSLLADSLDNLGDVMVYGISLFVVSKGLAAKSRVALFKGLLIFAAAFGVALQIFYKLLYPDMPLFEVMGAFSILGLIANSACLYLLWRHRDDDINMSSVWECSRNDIASNLSVFVAGGLVWLTASGWPDILVATALVFFLLRSSIKVISSAITNLKIA
ncbi:MAG: cation transporter [Acidobacteria bacterium]|nr:cation transporter [Acidobacteriota bacterium]